LDGQNLTGIGNQHSKNTLVFPDDERGNEPSKAYRLNLQRYENAIYMNLGTMSDSPAME
jgi:hypothetical protein